MVAASDGCKANLPCVVAVPSPKLWSPESPFLYNMTVTAGADSVDGYFGMREVKLGKDAAGTTRPMINGKFRFLAGFLDQVPTPCNQSRCLSLSLPVSLSLSVSSILALILQTCHNETHASEQSWWPDGQYLLRKMCMQHTVRYLHANSK